MADTVKLDSAKAIPRAWRILMYAVSIMGFGNVAMCSWLPAKLRMATVVYHGLSLLIHIINAIIFLVGFQFTGPFYILIPKLNILFLVICGAALCAANFFATLTQRPNACLYNWAKYNIGEEKSNLQAICVFLVPALTTLFSLITCYYHGNMMYIYEDEIIDTLSPLFVGWPSIQRIMYWKLVFISELIKLAATLYSALSGIIMIEIYICVLALYEDLLAICTKQHVSQCELQVWRRKYRCLENTVRSVNGYLGGSVLVLLALGVSSSILATYYIFGEGIVDPGLVLPFCNMVVVMASLTLPSAALSAKVSRTMRKA